MDMRNPAEACEACKVRQAEDSVGDMEVYRVGNLGDAVPRSAWVP